jgi:hypothetical protein
LRKFDVSGYTAKTLNPSVNATSASYARYLKR